MGGCHHIKTETRDIHMKSEAEPGVTQLQAKESRSYLKLLEERKDLPLRFQREHSFGFLASRTAKQYISVA